MTDIYAKGKDTHTFKKIEKKREENHVNMKVYIKGMWL
jgi:hypothetical protein